MNIENILKEYSEDKGKIGSHRFKEISPFVWVETGCATTWVHDSKSVVVDGETYRKEFVRDNCIVPYWAFPLALDFQKFAIDLKTKDVIELTGLLGKYTYSVAPHFTADVYAYCGWGIQEPPLLDMFEPIDKTEKKKGFGKRSENHDVNMIINLCNAYDVETSPDDYYGDDYWMHITTRRWEEKQKPVLHFRRLLKDYGWNNAVYCDFTFGQLLDMNPNIFLEHDIKNLEEQCRRNKIINQTLNFNVFKRQLTDTEKVDCAAKLFNFIVKHQKLSTSCNPSIQNHF